MYTDRENRREAYGGPYRRPNAFRRTKRAGGRAVQAVLTVAVLAGIVCATILYLRLRPRPAPLPDAAAAGTPPAIVWTAAESASPAAAPEQTEQPAADEASGVSMLEWKEGQFVAVEYGSATSTELDTSGFTDPSTKNSHDLVEWVKMAWENQWGYVWGTFGYILTPDLLASKFAQYPEELEEYADVIREKWIGRRVADCVGLIKSYGWYDPAVDSIGYNINGMPDTGTDGMWEAASVKGDMDTMPDEPGVLVYSTAGHIGVYIGDGYAIEAISHAGGVVKTKVADRPWTGWLQCPYIRYDTDG